MSPCLKTMRTTHHVSGRGEWVIDVPLHHEVLEIGCSQRGAGARPTSGGGEGGKWRPGPSTNILYGFCNHIHIVFNWMQKMKKKHGRESHSLPTMCLVTKRHPQPDAPPPNPTCGTLGGGRMVKAWAAITESQDCLRHTDVRLKKQGWVW